MGVPGLGSGGRRAAGDERGVRVGERRESGGQRAGVLSVMEIFRQLQSLCPERDRLCPAAKRVPGLSVVASLKTHEPHVGRLSVYWYHLITDLCWPEWCSRRMALRLLRSGLDVSRSSEESGRLGPSSEVQEPSPVASVGLSRLGWP